MLYLSGYGLELDDIEAFRSFGSRTPGHPEAGHTPGIEVTTGPLGQGFANAVGMAIAERVLRDRFGAHLVDHHTYVIAGDGCLMEGVSHEAASLAGHLGLGRLIAVFDDNRVTIDGSTTLAVTDDVGERFAAYGWHVEYLGEIGDDCDALEAALLAARADETRPDACSCCARTSAIPSPDHTDDYKAHGNPFTAAGRQPYEARDGDPRRAVLGAARGRRRVPGRRRDRRRPGSPPVARRPRRARRRRARGVGRGVGRHRHEGMGGRPADVRAGREASPPVKRSARSSRASFPYFPGLVSGAADLTGNTGTKLPDEAGMQSAENPGGRQVYYGIREHAMGGALVGMARHGGILPVGGTFFVFLDYMREPVRLAVDVAGQGGLRLQPRLGRRRRGRSDAPAGRAPGDAARHARTCRSSARPTPTRRSRRGGPPSTTTGRPPWCSSRQGIPVRTDGSAVERGAGIVRDSAATPALVLVATGSEVAVAIDAATELEAVRHGDPRREPAELGPLRPPGTRVPRRAAAAGRPRAVGRGGHHVRLGALRRRQRRHRPLRGQRTRATSCSTGWASTSANVVERARALLDAMAATRGADDGATDPPLRGVRPEPLARQPAAGLPHVRASWPGCATAASAASRRTRRSSRRRSPARPTTTSSSTSSSGDAGPVLDDYWTLVIADITGACDVFDPPVRGERRPRRLRQRRGRARAGRRLGRHRGRGPASCTSGSPGAT